MSMSKTSIYFRCLWARCF